MENGRGLKPLPLKGQEKFFLSPPFRGDLGGFYEPECCACMKLLLRRTLVQLELL